ncbi:porin family protein [Flavobacterium sp.]|uniref:porin family protein n=1 Tax=Flavobacterium sp. TaxID=239 RepID=UPI00261E4BE4|nr:porin family protein [Flavobacterium sp.]
MRFLLSIVFFLFGLSVFAQEKTVDFDAVDSLYREDQFYFGLTYNKLQNTPSGLSQNKFSSGISVGFLRDMPINKARTWAIALGLGYSLNNYNDNLFINNSDAENLYFTDSSVIFDKNKLSLHFVDVPLEVRWRNSTPESHKFWRVYTGFKVSYLIYDRYKFTGEDGKIIITGNKDLNKIHYGTYVAMGWNTWNFYAYYGLNPLFKSTKIAGKDLDMNTLNLGLMFYIL